MSKSKWHDFKEEIIELVKTNDEDTEIAKQLLNTRETTKQNSNVDSLRKYIAATRNRGIKEALDSINVDHTTAKHLWHEIKDVEGKKIGNAFIKNPDFKEQQQKNLEDLGDKILKNLLKYSPTHKKIKRVKSNEGNLLVIDIADLHINKYATSELTGAEYNSKIAVERAIEGTRGLLQKSSGFHIEKILFVIGNDVLNTDNLRKSTTKDTPQDTDTHWLEAFEIAYKCYAECIDLCLQVADVDIVHCVSNHDFMSGCFLAKAIQAHYRLSKNITFDIGASYRKYYQYHTNLIELEHGDKGKVDNLPLLIAQSQPQMWANTKFRYCYLHHVHHQDKKQYQSGKDYIGINITYLRSPSSADIWHADSTYLNMVAIEGFIHSKYNGRVSHLTHYF
jgi:hypothetical protein